MKKRLKLLVLLLTLCVFLAGCIPVDGPSEPSESSSTSEQEESEPSSESESSSEQEESESSSEPDPVEELLDGMTLEDKVGQLFFLAYRQDANRNNLLTLDSPSLSQLKRIRPGGVILFGENIRDVDQIRTWISDAQSTAKIPLFVSVDQEGGAIQRIAPSATLNATRLPNMFEVGRTGDASLARKVGKLLGTELSVFGFNMDFAPDCDVFSNPNNTVIGKRAFSTDPQVVATMSVEASAGFTDTGIIPVAKHFPGHGDTNTDSHLEMAVSYKTLDELRKNELIPFAAQIAAGVPAIMVAHVSLPNVTGDYTPATLSKTIVTDLLRGEMGYDGLIITDALKMGAVTQKYTSGPAAIKALQAGVDLLLMPEDPDSAYNAVVEAVKTGELSEERIDRSVRRILSTKRKYGLFSERPLTDPSVLGCAAHLAVVDEINARQP